MIPTPHINVSDKNKIAKTVLMPGDPLRAKFIADTYLENVEQINEVRGMLGFTGYYKGKKVTVIGSGMGMASIGIYSFELFKFYDVDNIIRIGSCGSYSKDLDIYDVILAESAYSESTYADVQSSNNGMNLIAANENLNNKLDKSASELDIKIKKGVIHSSDVFYRQNKEDYIKIRDTHKCLAVEMESFALFHNANVLNKNAACILTVSDSLVTNAATSSKERQEKFTSMVEITLNIL